MRQKISVIIPVLNEANTLAKTLGHLHSIYDDDVELIVVDGGSNDDTPLIAQRFAQLINSPRGRAVQMNHGAIHATGEILLFLHSDSLLHEHAFTEIRNVMRNLSNPGGCFTLHFDDTHPAFRLIEFGSNLRVRLGGWMFGDQGIFVRREIFTKLGGYPEIELMEDWEFSRRLKKRGKPVLLPLPITTSSRRFRKFGIWRTFWLMQRLKLNYLLGTPPAELKKLYPNQN